MPALKYAAAHPKAPIFIFGGCRTWATSIFPMSWSVPGFVYPEGGLRPVFPRMYRLTDRWIYDPSIRKRAGWRTDGGSRNH